MATALAFAAAFAGIFAPSGAAVAAKPNVVTNPGFEQVGANGIPVGWEGDPSVWASDATVAHSGSRSVRITNTNPAVYRLLTQRLPIRGGRAYVVSCWVKTENVQGPDSGATIALEWTDRQGKWAGGFYPDGVKGTSDWRQIKDESPPIPADAGSVSLVVYLRQGMTGRAWFDDVEVTEAVQPLLIARLVSPPYRGIIPPVPGAEVRARVQLGTDTVPLRDMMVRLEILPASGTGSPLRHVRELPTRSEFTMSIPAGDLPPGHYVLRVAVAQRRTQETLAAQSFPLEKAGPGGPNLGVMVGPRNVLLVGGRPFFPIGVYEGVAVSAPEAVARLEEIAGGPFNTVLNYGMVSGTLGEVRAYLSAADALGLKVIFSIKDLYEGTTYFPKSVGTWTRAEDMVRGVVQTFRDSPALLAWYVNDELSPKWLPQLQNMYQLVRQLDPNHPTYAVLYQVGQLARYAGTTDVLGVDPYPIPNNPVNMVLDWTRSAVATGLPVWTVIQSFDWSVYNKTAQRRPPTRDELRCMTYLALIGGAKGIVYYSYFDMKRAEGFQERWAELKSVASEVKELSPALLQPEPDLPSRVVVSPGSGIQWAVRRDGATLVIMAANPTAQAITAKFTMPEPVGSVAVQFEDRSLAVDGRSFSDTFRPLEVHVYRVSPARAPATSASGSRATATRPDRPA